VITPLPSVFPTRAGRARLVIGAASVLVVAVVAALTGPADISLGSSLREILSKLPFIHVSSGLTALEREILWSWRLPRIVLGALVGAVLSVSGAAYQGVFRNPLADPYLLGAAAGAGLGATLAFASGADGLVAPAAFLGAIAAVTVTYGLGRTAGGRTSTALILAGVAMASFLTAVQTFVLQANVETLREVYVWILGRLTTTGWNEVALLAPYAAVSIAAVVLHRRVLDAMAVGDDEATALGVPVARARIVIVVFATLGTAAAVAVSGLIGFVGIIVPHAVRLLAGTSYRVVVPLSALFGAAFLVAADLAARTVMSPAELPIGVVTAFLGAPFFVVVLRMTRRVA
jgi:iron complex transport system permease protein